MFPGATGHIAAIPAPESGNVYTFATATSSQSYIIPDEWKGTYVTFQADGEDIDIVFGGDSVSATLNQIGSVTSNVMTPNAASGIKIPAGQHRAFVVPNRLDVTRFAVISGGTSGFWRAYRSQI